MKDYKVVKKKQNDYSREWHKLNKEKHNTYIREKAKDVLAWFKEYKSKLCCSRCPETHPSCLEFHHLNPKEKKFNVGPAPRRYPIKTILEEIEKCEVVCSNCHRKEHW